MYKLHLNKVSAHIGAGNTPKQSRSYFYASHFKGVADLCKDVIRLWFVVVQCTTCYNRVQGAIPSKHQQLHSFPHRSADYPQPHSD